ncbi:MFS transporter, MCP family, solute carrier family 16 (monocarboxylic acid transporters), member 12 [Mytilus galloprovincialis]|uniref:MFS transporter, MCP family, solute carrier family 16 (Monocarboxylic acid transporters), member 12 n=1 Tax=Mytilus galloprovincialis TaxID=29158 RepID=A0A8B6C2P6_MYTGA|nr:MFS transporter, MCP family, solute carrier family 16 (monocarboxylic acid transporters), member 12 [Mytilus galloprovincialis]
MSVQDTDKGFSWIILCASFLNYTLISGTIRTFGILYSELLQTYDKGAGNTAFLGSIMFFVMAITGPVSGLLSVHFSFKWCTMIGGLISSIGMVTSSFTQDIEMLFLTYSCLLGIGFGLSAPPTVTIINFYFEKKRAFANGFLTASMGLSSLTYPFLYRKLIDQYGIHGAMLILGGLLFNICVGGSFFRQPSCFIRTTTKNNSPDSTKLLSEANYKSKKSNLTFVKNKIIDMFKSYSVALRNKSFVLYCFAMSFALVGYSSNFLILPPHIQSQQFSKDDVVIVLTVIGATEFVVRLFSGTFIDLQWFSVQTVFIVTMFMGGVCAIVLTFFKSMAINITYAVTVGIFPGILHSLQPLLIVTSLGLKMLPTAFPLSSFFTNTACLIGHPSLGWLEDYTGNWKASFYTVGGLFIASSLCVLLEQKLVKTPQSEEMTVRTDNTTEVTTNFQNNTNNIHSDDVETSLMGDETSSI